MASVLSRGCPHGSTLGRQLKAEWSPDAICYLVILVAHGFQGMPPSPSQLAQVWTVHWQRSTAPGHHEMPCLTCTGEACAAIKTQQNCCQLPCGLQSHAMPYVNMIHMRFWLCCSTQDKARTAKWLRISRVDLYIWEHTRCAWPFTRGKSAEALSGFLKLCEHL